MAVFTAVSKDDFLQWAQVNYPELDLIDIVPILDGIENTNFRVKGVNNNYVFTIFELWTRVDVEYYSALLQHLNHKNMPVPSPVGGVVNEWQGKPCVLVLFVEGASIMQTDHTHCYIAGKALAQLHLAASDFTLQHSNPRNYWWRRDGMEKILDSLSNEQQQLLHQAHRIDTTFTELPLPSGAVHCDFFRNNVLWQNNTIAAIIDFYFGGQDHLIFDLAVCACDWCFDTERQIFCEKRLKALLTGYHQHRHFCDLEKRHFADALCVAATRFWISRWYDVLYPRQAQNLTPHDPTYFEIVLSDALQRKDNIQQLVQAVA